MESMCRVCLAENVPTEALLAVELQEIYQKLTLLPFQSECARPLLVCYMCLVHLRKAHKLMVSCLHAEKYFLRILESNVVSKPSNLSHKNGLSKLSFKMTAQVDICCEELISGNLQPCELICIKEEISKEDLETEEADDPDWSNFKNHNVENITVEIVPEDIKYDTCSIDFSPIKKEIEGGSSENDNDHVTSSSKTRLKNHTRSGRSFRESNQYQTSPSENLICNDVSTHTYSLVDKQFRCDTCQKLFKKRNHLNRHFLTHTNEKPYICGICSRGFAESSNLKKHYLSHTGEKPHKCQVCERSFRASSNLKIHMHTHTGARPFQCHICPRTFTQSFSLVKHVRTHTGEKPFECDMCRMPFRNMCHLKRHLLTHTGEKPFGCAFCHRSFTRKYNLQAHNRAHHASLEFEDGSTVDPLESIDDSTQIPVG